MGRPGDEGGWLDFPDQLPRHDVTLSDYEIGKYEVTNQQVCDVYNWANAQGFIATVDATTVAAFGEDLLDLDDEHSRCQIRYSGGAFLAASRDGYSMADHPVVMISWYGAVAYCNWLSEMLGLTPVYDINTWTADFANDGYHLPTEAQWERAAAWDPAAPGGPKHWVYGFASDTLEGTNRCNYVHTLGDFVNPLGLASYPYTSPVGWFDGVNVSPNGRVATVDSPSPVGCYDMTGNSWEWCHDWYDGTYYTTGGPPWNDPTGPESGSDRVPRGGSWRHNSTLWSPSAFRAPLSPSTTRNDLGFRLAR